MHHYESSRYLLMHTFVFYILDLQKQLIQMGDEIDAAHGNKRKLTILQRQFELSKQQLADFIMHLYGMEQYDSIIPIIKEQYAAD